MSDTSILGGSSDPSAAATNAASAASASALAASAAKTSSATSQIAGNMTEFLSLLTTQLQNQDPLNPMDSSTFTQQLVEYSQVEQQINTNSKLDTLSSLSLNQSLSLALGYVGKTITYTSADMNFDGSTPVNVSYALPTDSASTTASIVDSNGNTVFTKNLSTTAGTSNFTWDGTETDGSKAPVGTYTVNITAPDGTGTNETVSTAVTGNVSGVESQDGTPFLLVGARAVALGNVINAKTAAATNTTTPSTSTGS